MRTFKTVATKISTFAKQRVKKIEKKKGISEYNLAQMVYDSIIRYMDDKHNLTPEMERIMTAFEHMEGWKDALNLADPTVEKVTGEAIYFLFDQDGKKKGCRAVHVVKPFFGQWTQNLNVKDIFERVMELLFPGRYRQLRQIAIDLDCNSILELLDYFIVEQAKEADLKAIREEFEDADRSDYGIKPIDAPYKRHHQKTLDLFEQHEAQYQSREEIERRSEEARQWLEEHMDFKPFSCEW